MGRSHLVFLLVALPVVSARSVRKDFSYSKEVFPPRPRVNRYITEVYKRVKRNEDGSMNVEVRKQTTKVDEIYGYQTIKGGQIWGVNRARFDFNTSDLDRRCTVLGAELVLTARRGFPSQPVNVTVDLVRREPNGHKTLGWQVLHRGLHGLLIFDVRQAVEYWMAVQQAHGKLVVRVKNVSANASSQHAGLIHSQSAFRRGRTKGPFLVVYLNRSADFVTSPVLVDLLKKQTVLLPTTLPISFNTEYVSRKLSSTWPFGVQGKPRAGFTQLVPSCQYSPLKMVLTRLFNWVIEPSTPITVGMCFGLCYPYLGSSWMSTKHATLIADMLKSRGVKEPMRPYCVPMGLTGMIVAFLDEETGTSKVQVWDNLIVKKCGCR